MLQQKAASEEDVKRIFITINRVFPVINFIDKNYCVNFGNNEFQK
jgi:hypothetical protein